MVPSMITSCSLPLNGNETTSIPRADASPCRSTGTVRPWRSQRRRAIAAARDKVGYAVPSANDGNAAQPCRFVHKCHYGQEPLDPSSGDSFTKERAWRVNALASRGAGVAGETSCYHGFDSTYGARPIQRREAWIGVNAVAGKTSRNSTKVDAKPILLSGGNPQIAKADGDAPVQAYIAAMPDWKSGLGRRLDDLIVHAVPNVRKAVRWNSPWYGVEGEGWFASYHVFTRYVKVTFLNGASLRPSHPAQAMTRTRAGSTSTKASSTRSRWRRGSGRRPPYPAGVVSTHCEVPFIIVYKTSSFTRQGEGLLRPPHRTGVRTGDVPA